MNKLTNKTNAPSSAEATDGNLALEARLAAVERINALTMAIKNGVMLVRDTAVKIGNDAIQLGLFIQEATGHQQLELREFNALLGVDKELTFWLAQRCVNLVNRRGAKYVFKDLADVQPELQALFQGMNLLQPAPRSRKEGEPLQSDWGSWIPLAFAPVNSKLQELLAEEQMESWTQERLETFAAQSQFVHEQHVKAKGLLTTDEHG